MPKGSKAERDPDLAREIEEWERRVDEILRQAPETIRRAEEARRRLRLIYERR